MPHDTYAMTTTSVHTYVTELLQLCYHLACTAPSAVLTAPLRCF